MKHFGWAVLLVGCASIHPPDGGPPDRTSPTVRRMRFSQRGQKAYLTILWREYLSPASELAGKGIWINPPHPFQAKLAGKRLRLRIDSVSGCWVVWGGEGLKDFTEGNPFSPQPLWVSCPTADTLLVAYTLESKAPPEAPVWAELYAEGRTYRFLGIKGEASITLQVGYLPQGTYHAWAWADEDGDGRWSLSESIWLYPSPLIWPPARRPDSLKGALQDTIVWTAWQADTLPPSLPRVSWRDSVWAVLTFKEPVLLSVVQGEGYSLSAKTLLLRNGTIFAVADSAGHFLRDTLLVGRSDTQRYEPVITPWEGANLTLPQWLLRSSETWEARDSFWVGRIGDTLYAAELQYRGHEICLYPLLTAAAVEVNISLPTRDTVNTVKLKLPARKYPVSLPQDSPSGVRRWRIYGPQGWIGEAPPGAEVWLPPGTYTLLGLGSEGPFWRPVQIREGRPFLTELPLVRTQLQVLPRTE
ncbi:MAG: hypothetical protein N3A68_01715 [Bacteroidia bacterium]|nr:hypothetical protein [Bacteroidia bacterium]